MKKPTVITTLVMVLALAAVIFLRERYSEKVAINGSQKDYKNATYIIDGKNIVLINGVSEVETVPGSASRLITRYFGNEAVGDLNNDGMEDVALLLTQEGSGSGIFFYAVVALKTKEGFSGTNGIFLGDRIAPQPTEIKNGYVIVNYADRALDEPIAISPSVGKSKYLALEKNILVESPIFVEFPYNSAAISSPLIIAGVAKGLWFFEASFPLVLTDEKGTVIAQSHASAEGEWMTPGYVRFSGKLEFKNPDKGSRGTLFLKKDNPSGLPEHDDSREISVFFK